MSPDPSKRAVLSASSPVMVTQTAYVALQAERDRLSKALKDFTGAADWYRRCLEDAQARKPVRGLDEARAGFEHHLERALQELREAGRHDV